jgi:hypothetical protein
MTFDRSGTTDLQRRFLELTLLAMRELDRMEARPTFAPYFRIWDYDPHRTYRSWLLQIPDDADPLRPAPIVLERTWDAAEDRERLARDLRRRPRLQPTLYIREARLPNEEFSFLRSVGSRISYPRLELRDAHTSLQPTQFGLEGFRKETVQLRSDRIRLEWGGMVQPELKAVAAWAERVRSLCSGCFPDETISILRAGMTGICSLCRQPALKDTQSCPDCRATYHQQCWEYVGRCAIYGCTGTVSL